MGQTFCLPFFDRDIILIMKRILIGLLLCVVILLAAVYALFPEKYVIATSSSFSANRDGVYRFLLSDSNWQKWWPGTLKGQQGTVILQYNAYRFQIEKIEYGALQLDAKTNDSSVECLLKLVPYSIDSMGIELSSELRVAFDPVSRISGYFRARSLKHALDTIVSSLANYTSNLKNIYGINIKKEKVQYQFVLSDKQSYAHYPTIDDIYGIIGTLRDYIKRSGAKELFWPMLNISRPDSMTYVAQLGIPTDRELPQQQTITSKWMMKGGNILSGEVIGGPQRIDEAMKQFELYIHDYQRSIIAIPFQMLITDRSKERDSTKWVTRIYYPVV
jgi:hypothetical protein